jgi:hypothetical protein
LVSDSIDVGKARPRREEMNARKVDPAPVAELDQEADRQGRE